MCGIVGYIGEEDVKEILLKGLEKLEYRGYDSAGISVRNGEELKIFKEAGRIKDLREKVDPDFQAATGIGHTRWATHGEPSVTNAHPHQSADGRFTLVHNGVIENYEQIKQEYLPETEFVSSTDTEIIVELISALAKEGRTTEEAFKAALDILHGSYALGLLDKDEEDVIYVAKNKSPLLLGKGEGFNVITSDAMAMLHLTDEFVELMDGELVLLKRDGITIKDRDGNTIERESYIAEIDESDTEKGTYEHYMLKEINDQPAAMRKIIQEYQDENGELSIDTEIMDQINDADRVYIIAAGTSYHAGLIGKEYFEKWAGIPTEVHVASEFVYNTPLLSKRPLFVFISQSGETADSRAVLVEVKRLGHKTLTVTNVPGSTLSREADQTLILHAGPEIAVASTKAYTAQIAVLAILAQVAARALGRETGINLTEELAKVTTAITTVIDDAETIEGIVHEYLETTRNAFFIGRAMDHYVGLEGALKLKEISYIQAEGFAGGELKHGTIALIEEGTPVFALATQEKVNLNIRGNAQEVQARGANVCTIAMEGLESENDAYVLPNVHSMLTPLVSVVVYQFISYYAALHRGNDVDKPRNLAKSVTVE
ncbi:glutamine--fructose-6-phosphate transaminase (isomerizing) [Salinicoccus halitifaciens]|uniref:Glutamine--fructose-6-phosphate aminotransferase [isomerizing] n=1 Tax=Salinicoccus halitifaciens TaxID=1073415 RepID=A0ABV2ECF9_9STAP|nr:glutamine--fructose-6-phosphate transaminase (isomerizing) [Salinicoccus halitifaciens]MCD2138970.1 glutamine--fructose-6-phosphate transaminase (isomerizing) [Salinicoccus halitifaciens]